MLKPLKNLAGQINSKSVNDRELILGFKNIVGKQPGNLALYKLALCHASNSIQNENGFSESNERLEFLGDAILDAVISDYLFRKYPFKDEGFMTEIRSKIVSRDSLNNLAVKIGVPQIFKLSNDQLKRNSYKSVYGNALEAIIGAVYVDRGYNFCYKFIINKLVIPYFDLSEVISSTTNFKSKLIEWGQKENKEVTFEIIEIKDLVPHKEFTAKVFINNEPMNVGYGRNKKKAEQNAAFETLNTLNIQ